jgi:phospholipase D3/4
LVIYYHEFFSSCAKFFQFISGTSNWSGDYFINTGGVAVVIKDPINIIDGDNDEDSLRKQLAEVFDRDWNSPYSMPIE